MDLFAYGLPGYLHGGYDGWRVHAVNGGDSVAVALVRWESSGSSGDKGEVPGDVSQPKRQDK